MHQISGVFPKARRKFSLLIVKSKVREMTFTRFFGAGRSATSTLPARVAIPTHVLTSPRTVFPPFCLDNSIAGSAASHMDATRLMQARYRIKVSISGFFPSHVIPFRAAVSKLSSACLGTSFSGIGINKNSVKKANAKVIKSTRITESIPANVNNVVASTGVKIEFSE